jgi:hypothetical protein
MIRRMIEEKRLWDLLKAEAELSELEAMGVDNWCGYDECERIEDETINEQLEFYPIINKDTK